MKIHHRQLVATVSLCCLLTLTGTFSLLRADTGTCNGTDLTLPFLDVAGNQFFCAIAAAYVTGITVGTGANSFTPSGLVARDQMSAFVTRTLDYSLKRGSQRAALNQFWTPTFIAQGAAANVGNEPDLLASDGADLWVANNSAGTVSRVRASDMKVLSTWTGATGAKGVCVARGRIFVTGETNPGKVYVIDPTQAPGNVTTLVSNLGAFPKGIAYDGTLLYVAVGGGNGQGNVSIIDLSSGAPDVSVHSAGFTHPQGLVFDGTAMWLTDAGDHQLKKLTFGGIVIKSIDVGSQPSYPICDGVNIWVPNYDGFSVTVVRASNGALLTTLQSNNLNHPVAAG